MLSDLNIPSSILEIAISFLSTFLDSSFSIKFFENMFLFIIKFFECALLTITFSFFKYEFIEDIFNPLKRVLVLNSSKFSVLKSLRYIVLSILRCFL